MSALLPLADNGQFLERKPMQHGCQSPFTENHIPEMLTEHENGYSHQHVQEARFNKNVQHPNTIKKIAAMACVEETNYNSSQHRNCREIAFDDMNSTCIANSYSIEDHNVCNKSNVNTYEFD